MQRSHIIALLALAVAVPAAGAAANSLLSAPEGPCFIAGTTGYRLTATSRADYTIRIDNEASRPDLTVELVSDPAAADFVLVDDGDRAHGCDNAATVRTIRLDHAAAEPDLTIALTQQPGTGRFRIYAQAAGFSGQDAAALFAVVWKSAKKRHAAIAR